jgi:hypothetical protein
MHRVHKLITHKRVLLAGAVGGAGLLIGGIAYASMPGGDGVIHACYKTSKSEPVRVSIVESGQPGRPFVTVDAGSISQITLECPSGTVPMAANWFVNQNGDAGSHGDVSANASGPTIGDRAWTIVLKNSGGSAVTVGEHLLCVEGAVQ